MELTSDACHILRHGNLEGDVAVPVSSALSRGHVDLACGTSRVAGEIHIASIGTSASFVDLSDGNLDGTALGHLRDLVCC